MNLCKHHPTKQFLSTILYIPFISFFFFVPPSVLSQNIQKDTSTTFVVEGNDSIVVTAFRQTYLIHQLPASVTHLSRNEFSFLGGASMLPAVNQVPGVRMEERSPGSYRFSIRGSLLRSPFGVRNVKVYLNQVPLSDAGGNTYLNLLPASLIRGLDIIKGPAASSYGAGTGGVLLIHSDIEEKQVKGNRLEAAVAGGSFDLFRQQMSFESRREKSQWQFDQDHQQSTGYREQTTLRRNAFAFHWQQKAGMHTFNTQLLYAKLFYQTPGGLTLSQMQQNPRQARPASAQFPGAVTQNTSVSNETALLSISHDVPLSPKWNLHSFLLGGRTLFTNPFITNFEQRKERNGGAGTNFRYFQKKASHTLEWQSGFELLIQNSQVTNFSNKNGNPDTLQWNDHLQSIQWFVYSQISLHKGNWQLDAGISMNQQQFNFERASLPSGQPETRRLQALATPRLSLTRKMNARLQIQLLVSRGFSPPTLAEIRPSDGNFYGNLQPESGWNTEIGWRWSIKPGSIYWTGSVYSFELANAIVRRNSTSGTEYFINAGGTNQRGFENSILWKTKPIDQSTNWQCSWEIGYTYQPYLFKAYQQGATNYSGKAVTGVPRHILTSINQFSHRSGFYAQLQLNATSKIPLNDANDEWSAPYQLMQAETGWHINRKGNHWQFFISADNLLNQNYGLGSDINAAGRRFYNPAPRLNFLAGIRFNRRSFVF